MESSGTPRGTEEKVSADIIAWFISYTYSHFRVAMKKSGPTIESFLKKMQKQMGVAIIGFAAYRDSEGKLCTFEYVAYFLHDPLCSLNLTLM